MDYTGVLFPSECKKGESRGETICHDKIMMSRNPNEILNKRPIMCHLVRVRPGKMKRYEQENSTVYYEQLIKRYLEGIHTCGCLCNERLMKVKTDGSTRLSYKFFVLLLINETKPK